MSAHLRQQALRRYGIELTDADVDEIHAQCRAGRHLIRSFRGNRIDGPSDHHGVVVRGVRMCAVLKRGVVATVLGPDWLQHDDDTAIAAAFRRAMSSQQHTPHTGD
jgi:hypothetical protein